MNNEKMTIHKALSELKTLDARIEKEIKNTTFAFANKHSNGTVDGVKISEVCDEIKANYQSINDLMARRSAIKKAIMLSNAVTKVIIGGNEYTVSEAIEIKNHAIPMLRMLYTKMHVDISNARVTSKNCNGDALESRADSYIKTLYENADMKNASDQIKRVREDFIASQTVEIVDPIGITDEMKKLEDKINAFVVDVDSALSVSNALTEIEISY